MSTEHPIDHNKPFNFLPFALAVFVLATCVAGFYYINFADNGASLDPTSWAEFGDYFGGVLNPIIGLFTIIILAMTLRLNSDQLQQSRMEVKLSQEALKVAMEELKRGQELQEITEKSLREQIEALTKQNDMTSAVNLLGYWKDCMVQTNELAQQHRSIGEFEIYKKYLKTSNDHAVKQGELARILWEEHDHLVTKYGTAMSNS